jgi:hypothetical protein
MALMNDCNMPGFSPAGHVDVQDDGNEKEFVNSSAESKLMQH